MTGLGIIVAALFSQNFVLSKSLGICPFLGVSKKTGSAFSMGIAVTMVMVLTCLVTYPLYRWVLVPLQIEYLEIILFILVIASLVQMLEMILKKVSPGLYSALGVYLPLVTTNCAILGVAELVIGKSAEGFVYSMGGALLYGLFAGLGFTLAIVLMSGLREKVDKSTTIPRALRGFPSTMLIACFMAMAFTVFNYIAS